MWKNRGLMWWLASGRVSEMTTWKWFSLRRSEGLWGFAAGDRHGIGVTNCVAVIGMGQAYWGEGLGMWWLDQLLRCKFWELLHKSLAGFLVTFVSASMTPYNGFDISHPLTKNKSSKLLGYSYESHLTRRVYQSVRLGALKQMLKVCKQLVSQTADCW